MALLTFDPSIAPSPNGTSNPVVNLNKAEFGDGYTQSSPNGLNHIRNVIGLRWDGVTLAQKDELEQFFVDHGGYIPFFYQPFGVNSVLKWKCETWGSTTNSPIGFSAELRQDFSLAE